MLTELQLAGEQRGGGAEAGGGGADEAGLGVVLAAALPRHPQRARAAPAARRQARHQALAEPRVGIYKLFMMVSKVDGTFNVIKLLIDIFN